MSWAENHTLSAELAAKAQVALRSNDVDEALHLYSLAGERELDAFNDTDPSKLRTRGITIVSAIALFYKGRNFERAEKLAYANLASTELPAFATEQLRDLVQSIWTEKEFQERRIGFTEGEVLISVSGGDIVTGGAPLDLILTKVSDISRYFFRTIELLLDRPLRTRGAPDRYIQEQCRPWLFQAPAGSYQFAVRVQRPVQPELFGDDLPKIQHITDKFIEIIDAASREDVAALEAAVPKAEYRNTFAKMTRDLSPTGKTYSKLEIKPSVSSTFEKITLSPDSRISAGNVLKTVTPPRERRTNDGEKFRLIGTLRGLHLDKDWIEVTIFENQTEEHIKVINTGEVIDDMVGPMVNRTVLVDTIRTPDGRFIFQDIQIDE
jgi:hypothetical protein